jgi:hypothetical protein
MKSWIYEKSLLYKQLQAVPPIRLRSRKPIWIHDPGPTNECFDDQWSSTSPVNGHLIIDPTSEPPGFNSSRHEWVFIKRFRIVQDKCAYLMNRWGYTESMEHIINDGVCFLNLVTFVCSFAPRTFLFGIFRQICFFSEVCLSDQCPQPSFT